MTLRVRTLRLVGLSIAALVAVVYFTIATLSRGDYARLERREALKNIQRLKDAITTTRGSLDLVVKDWSAWDDTYAFIKDRNAAYQKSSLTDSSLSNLNINLIAYLDVNGRTVFIKALQNGHQTRLPTGLETYLKPGSPMLHGSNPSSMTSGLMRLPSGSMLVASRPILTSDGRGPSRGTLLMARYFDDELLTELGKVTHLSLSRISLQDRALADNDREDIAALYTGQEAVVHPEGNRTVAGYFLLRDVFGTPATVVQMKEPRQIYLQGEISLRYMLISLTVIGLVFGALSVWLLERDVLSRLTRLSNEVSRVGQSAQSSASVTVDGQDELGSLAATINTTFRALERAQIELQHREHELRVSEERYALAAQGANDGLWDWDIETDRLYLSERFNKILGYGQDEITPTSVTWKALSHPEDRERLEDEMRAHLEGHSPNFASQIRLLHKNGTYRWVLCRGLAVRDANSKAHRMAGSLTDLAERGSYYDTLTGLPSRRLFMDRLDRAVAHHARDERFGFSVLFMDVNRFKVLNDSLGHLIGDQLLVQMARRLEENMRPGDTVARLSGDEFVVLIENLNAHGEPSALAERLRRALGKPFMLDGHEVFSGISIGIATSPIGWTSSDYLRAADTAMYRAKALGTGIEVYDATMHTEALERMKIETGLRYALDRDELRVFYQPVVSLETGRAVGFEALVRWQHPERGLLEPGAFLPIAEETSLIAEIDAWVLRTACAQAVGWPTSPHEPARTVSVNFSSRSLAEPGLFERVKAALEETGLPARRLRLEITETALIKSGDHLQVALAQLRQLGVAILLDDFGQGYSSLSYLHRFPINTLKIDRAFVNDLVRLDKANGESSEIVQTIIALAHNMGIDVIAEGIETREQCSKLRALGSEYGQGYLFASPMDAALVASWDASTQAAMV